MVRLSEEDKWFLQSINDSIAADNSRRGVNQAKIISAAVSAAVAPLLKEIAGLRELHEQTSEKLIAMNEKLIEKNAKITQLEKLLEATDARN